MLRYPAKLKPAKEGGFVVTFRDIPEAITQGESIEDAMIQARDALQTALDFYFDDHREIPAASKARRGERLIELPASVSAKGAASQRNGAPTRAPRRSGAPAAHDAAGNYPTDRSSSSHAHRQYRGCAPSAWKAVGTARHLIRRIQEET